MITPKLSICIATYNRAEVIGQTLDSIVSQIQDGVEIVIVDGASTDHTSDVMRRYQDVCPSLRYYRMPVKGGVDRDYCNAVSFATGEYCWLLTDDDIVKPGTIKSILGKLSKKYSLIILNAEVRDKNLSEILEARHCNIDHDTFYPSVSLQDLFINTAGHLSFIGAVVIARALWNEREKEPYIGTEFVHIGVIFQKELPNGAFVMAEPCIIIRYGSAQWTTRYFEVWMIKWPGILWSFSNISDGAKSRIIVRNPWESIVDLMWMRAYGAYSPVEYKRFIAGRLNPRWKLLAAKVLSLVPGIFLNGLAIAYFTMRAPNKFIVYTLKISRFYYRLYLSQILGTVKKVIS
jgi:abequosyltransferase